MDFSSLNAPTRVEALVSFTDIQGFMRISEKLGDALAIFKFLDRWAAIMAREIESGGGTVIKFIGDSCLALFPEEKADLGVRSLILAKAASERFFAESGIPTRLKATCHFGEVAVGPFGPAGSRGIDVIGEAVNIAAMLERGDKGGRLVISPQAFRKLGPDTRKLFHKFTPPIVYVAEET
jgi:class 3 adenylate cyclase